jgi:hypothetical protein
MLIFFIKNVNSFVLSKKYNAFSGSTRNEKHLLYFVSFLLSLNASKGRDVRR